MRLLQKVGQDRLSLRCNSIYLELALLVVGIDILQAFLDLAELLGGGVVAEVVPLLEGVLQVGDAVVEGLQLLGYVVLLCGVVMVVMVVEVFGHRLLPFSLGGALECNSVISTNRIRDCRPIRLRIL